MKKNRNIIIFIIAGLIGLTLGILLCIESVWEDIIDLVIGIGLTVYLALYLIPLVAKYKSAYRLVIGVVEIVLVAVIALGMFFIQFKVINIGTEIIVILGVVAWLRGICDLFLYLFADISKNQRIIRTVIAAVLITLGTYCFAKPFLSNDTIRLVLIIVFFVVALISIVGIVLFATGKGGKRKAR